jgi:hypothetical protein
MIVHHVQWLDSSAMQCSICGQLVACDTDAMDEHEEEHQ